MIRKRTQDKVFTWSFEPDEKRNFVKGNEQTKHKELGESSHEFADIDILLREYQFV